LLSQGTFVDGVAGQQITLGDGFFQVQTDLVADFHGGFLGQTLIFCHIAMHADMGYKYIYGW
jgi:hypothetical protein